MGLKDFERRRFWKALSAVCLIAVVVGCTKAQTRYGVYGRYKRVELWSGGQKVQTWRAEGEVDRKLQSTEWSFTDADTHQIVRITGDVVVTTTNVGD